LSTATPGPHDHARASALAVTTGVTVLLAGAGLLSLWVAPPPDADLLMVIWALVSGAGFAAAARAVLGSGRAAVPGWLFLLGATLLLIAPSARAAGQPVMALVSVVLASAVAIPVGLLRVVERQQARAVLRVIDLVVMALGVTCAITTAIRVWPVALAAAIGVGVGMVCAGWLQFELTTGNRRRQLLWIIFGVCSSTLITVLLSLVFPDYPLSNTLTSVLTVSVLSLGIPLTAAIAVLAPRALDVRAMISRAGVLAVMLALVAAVYFGVEAGFTMQPGRPLARGLRFVLVAVIAVGFHPVMVRVQIAMDELLFGGRADPVDTLTRLGTELTAGSPPQEWLDTLRAALSVPSVELREDGRIVAASGVADGARTVTTELRAGPEHVGDLVVALPDDQLQLAPATRSVLGLIAAPLAQALHAVRLSEQVQASRGRVIAALEEERRRMRRDLHDGLGPTLTGIAYSADAASNLVSSDADGAAQVLRELRSDAAEAIAEIRRIIHDLRPKALDELGLVAAVAQRVSRLRAADGRMLHVEITAPDTLPELPAALEVVTYRVAVEAVTNVGRHSGVATALVTFTITPEQALNLTIEDQGHSPKPWHPGVGLKSMRERVEQIGGTLDAHASPNGGRVTASIPLNITPTS
jgi:signal transduction histidine kinase